MQMLSWWAEGEKDKSSKKTPPPLYIEWAVGVCLNLFLEHTGGSTEKPKAFFNRKQAGGWGNLVQVCGFD